MNDPFIEKNSNQGGTDSVIDLSVIIPTYCEAENLLELIPVISSELKSMRVNAEILVVDDNSPDDTIAICASFEQNIPVRLITRFNERGLSSAVVHGMRVGQGKVLLVMDADFSHPVGKISDLYTPIAKGHCDFIIGSRFIEGGTTDDSWGLFRWLNSKVATILARPLTTVRDPMAGFFAIRSTTFLAADQLDPIGYKIGLELIVKGNCSRICEVPIHFRNRHKGESKLSLREQVNYLRHILRLYHYRFRKRFLDASHSKQ